MVNSALRIITLVNIFCLSYIITACAASKFLRYEVIDDELAPYYNNYIQLIKHNCKSNKYNDAPRKLIVFVDKLKESEKEKELGVCTLGIFGNFKIEILKSWWDNADPIERQEMIYHEGAHCLLKKEHSPDKHNYLYAYFNTLPLDIATKQAIDDIKSVCK